MTFSELKIGDAFIFAAVQRANSDAKIKTSDNTYRYISGGGDEKVAPETIVYLFTVQKGT